MKINFALNVSVIFNNETNTHMNNMFYIRREYWFLRCVSSDDYMGLSKIQAEKQFFLHLLKLIKITPVRVENSEIK